MNGNKGRRLALLLAVCLLCAMLSGYASVTPTRGNELQTMDKVPVYVDSALSFTAYADGGRVYVPLRSFCGILGMGAVVSRDGMTGVTRVDMVHEGTHHTMTARAGDFYLYVNDRIVYLGSEMCSRSGNLLVPVEGLCNAFGITHSLSAGNLHLETDGVSVCQSGSEVYDKTDLKWLSQIIHAEAANQPIEGKICVGNVVLNRVAHQRFPDTVADVVFSPNQFCPVASGNIYCDPNEESMAAAKLCLEGVNLAGESTYFVNPVTGSTKWFRENLTYVMSIGDHDFYY